jgi:hypothetical protein
MTKSKEQIIKLIGLGASVIVDGSMTTEALVQIATEAAKKRVAITIHHAGTKTIEALEKIAKVGAGYVTLDLTPHE